MTRSSGRVSPRSGRPVRMAARLDGAGRVRGRCHRRGTFAARFMEASPCRGKTTTRGVSAMHLGASFKLGPFTVDSAGGLSPCDPAMAPAFLFRWHDRIVRARLDKADAETGRLNLQGMLARVSSSAGTPDESLRPRSFALLRWLERSTPSTWHVALLAD